MKQKILYPNNRPKISVLMSVFNDMKFLRQAIDSILNQTFQNFEFIIIDDASTEDVKSIIDSYKDKRIITYRNEKNLGLAGSLNVGLDMARGDYVARMDSDDISLRHRLEFLLKGFTNDNIGFVCCRSASVTMDMKRRESEWHDSTTHKTKSEIKETINKVFCVPTAPMMYSRKVVEKIGYYDEAMKSGEDRNYFFRMYKFFDFNVVEKTLYLARFNPNSYRRTPEYRKIDWGKLATERANTVPIVMSRGIEVTSAEKWWKDQYSDWIEQVNKESDLPTLPAQKSPKDLINVAFNVIIPSRIKEEQPSILEVGCGFARVTSYLKNILNYKNIYGLDQSENMLKMADEKFQKNNLFFGNLKQIAPWFPKFDIVYTCVVLVHIHPESILECLKNIISHANKFVIHIEHMPVDKTSYYADTHNGCWRHPYIKLYKNIGIKCEVLKQRRGKHAIYIVDIRKNQEIQKEAKS